MKQLLFVVALFSSAWALADQTPANIVEDKLVLSCSVPTQSGTAQVTADVTLGADLSQDFVTVEIKDQGHDLLFFTQMEKGQLNQSLKEGGLNFMLLTETTSQEGGVIRNAGFFAVSQDQSGDFGGFISAAGNIYPISCQLK